jgi:hypothetical protein
MPITLQHDTTLNPDGSGKVAVLWSGDPPSPDQQSGDFLASEIMNGKGIDAWRDLSCTIENGALKFQATAYFKNAAKLRFFCQGFHANVLDLVTSTDDQGNFTAKTPVPDTSSSAPASGSDEEILARLPGEREKFAQAKEFLGGMMGGLVCIGSIRLPGKIGKAKNGKKGPADTVKMRFEGKSIIDLLDRLMTDDALALRLLRSGQEGPEALIGLLGDQGPMEAVTTGKIAPLFDYDAEVAAAKEQFASIAETLNLPKPPELAPPMQNVRIVAAKLVREADSDRDLNPMGQNYPSLSYTIVGDLADGAVKAEEGRMETALTDAGDNLVPDDDWKRRISFPKLTNDRRSAIFEIELRLGDAPVEGFRELRGTVSIFASSGTEDVDLGFKKLEAGAAGKEYGATIERFEPQDEQRSTLDIKLLVSMERIDGIRLVTAKGEELPVSQQGYSSSGEECTLTYVLEGAVPKKFKLIARVAKDLHRLEVPFEIRDVDLLGRTRGKA